MWSSRPATVDGMWVLCRDGVEVGMLSLVGALATPSVTVARVLDALGRDGEP